MTKEDFEIYLLLQNKETHRDVFDILLDAMNDENIPVYYDNVKKTLSDNIKRIIENEAFNRHILKEEYRKKGLSKILDLL
jgi:hypothetical protein